MTNTLKLDPANLQQLFNALQSHGYMTIGPTVRDGAVVYAKIESSNELPVGWTDEQSPASYQLKKQNKQAYFRFHGAPQSWKRFLYPPTRSLFLVGRNGKALEFSMGASIHEKTDSDIKYAFIGVRPCELSAILIQDLVFDSDGHGDVNYKKLRENCFVVAVNCTESGDTCFCSSMKTGPRANRDFDLALIEVLNDAKHYFLVEVGSQRGASIIKEIETTNAEQDEIDEAEELISRAEKGMKKSLDTSDLPKFLSENFDHPHWDDVAKRCLTCGNCTLVCPTCFCSTVEDVTDLSGQKAERLQKWDSCFTLDFSKVAGGNFRISPKSRYRQWLTHKLSTWVEQFGVLGCVGCGRCITWCPVGIDITAEIQTLRQSEV